MEVGSEEVMMGLEDSSGGTIDNEMEKGALSPLTGSYLLIVLAEPHSEEDREIIIQRLTRGLLSWDVDLSHVDLCCELLNLANSSPEGDEARNGEKLVQWASENLVVEVLIHSQVNTLLQCMKNLLASFTRHRHIIHAGYTFQGSGSWILQDGTFSFMDFIELWAESDVQRILSAYKGDISVSLHCAPESSWTEERIRRESFSKMCQVRLNPPDKLSGAYNSGIVSFVEFISKMVVASPVKEILEPSEIVGNIRFSHPTLYVFPGGQGDAALFGINGFNMLIDGGFNRRSCFWDFTRHLDRLDAVLLTRINNNSFGGLDAILERKRINQVYPQIGHFFGNLMEKKSSSADSGIDKEKDKEKDELIVSLSETATRMMENLRNISLKPHLCFRENIVEPINLYHKVGHGKLDLYILNPAKDSREVKEFLSKWNTDLCSTSKMSTRSEGGCRESFPVLNLVSICALLVWQPANPRDAITRILFPGSTPQQKIFESLGRLKHLEFLKYPICSAKTISASQKSKVKSEKIISEAGSKLLKGSVERLTSSNIQKTVSSSSASTGPLKSQKTHQARNAEKMFSASNRSESASTTGEETRERGRPEKRTFKPTSDNKLSDKGIKDSEIKTPRKSESNIAKSTTKPVSAPSGKTVKKTPSVGDSKKPTSPKKTQGENAPKIPKYGINVSKPSSAAKTTSPPITPLKSAKEATNNNRKGTEKAAQQKVQKPEAPKPKVEAKKKPVAKSTIPKADPPKPKPIVGKKAVAAAAVGVAGVALAAGAVAGASKAITGGRKSNGVISNGKSEEKTETDDKDPIVEVEKVETEPSADEPSEENVPGKTEEPAEKEEEEEKVEESEASKLDEPQEDEKDDQTEEIIIEQNGTLLNGAGTESSSELSSLDHASVNGEDESITLTGAETDKETRREMDATETPFSTYTAIEGERVEGEEDEDYLIVEKDESTAEVEIDEESQPVIEESIEAKEIESVTAEKKNDSIDGIEPLDSANTENDDAEIEPNKDEEIEEKETHNEDEIEIHEEEIKVSSPTDVNSSQENQESTIAESHTEDEMKDGKVEESQIDEEEGKDDEETVEEVAANEEKPLESEENVEIETSGGEMKAKEPFNQIEKDKEEEEKINETGSREADTGSENLEAKETDSLEKPEVETNGSEIEEKVEPEVQEQISEPVFSKDLAAQVEKEILEASREDVQKDPPTDLNDEDKEAEEVGANEMSQDVAELKSEEILESAPSEQKVEKASKGGESKTEGLQLNSDLTASPEVSRSGSGANLGSSAFKEIDIDGVGLIQVEKISSTDSVPEHLIVSDPNEMLTFTPEPEVNIDDIVIEENLEILQEKDKVEEEEKEKDLNVDTTPIVVEEVENQIDDNDGDNNVQEEEKEEKKEYEEIIIKEDEKAVKDKEVISTIPSKEEEINIGVKEKFDEDEKENIETEENIIDEFEEENKKDENAKDEKLLSGDPKRLDSTTPSAIPSKLPRETREVIRTPDEVADLPVHEEVEPGTYETDEFVEEEQLEEEDQEIVQEDNIAQNDTKHNVEEVDDEVKEVAEEKDNVNESHPSTHIVKDDLLATETETVVEKVIEVSNEKLLDETVKKTEECEEIKEELECKPHEEETSNDLTTNNEIKEEKESNESAIDLSKHDTNVPDEKEEEKGNVVPELEVEADEEHLEETKEEIVEETEIKTHKEIFANDGTEGEIRVAPAGPLKEIILASVVEKIDAAVSPVSESLFTHTVGEKEVQETSKDEGENEPEISTENHENKITEGKAADEVAINNAEPVMSLQKTDEQEISHAPEENEEKGEDEEDNNLSNEQTNIETALEEIKRPLEEEKEGVKDIETNVECCDEMERRRSSTLSLADELDKSNQASLAQKTVTSVVITPSTPPVQSEEDEFLFDGKAETVESEISEEAKMTNQEDNEPREEEDKKIEETIEEVGEAIDEPPTTISIAQSGTSPASGLGIGRKTSSDESSFSSSSASALTAISTAENKKEEEETSLDKLPDHSQEEKPSEKEIYEESNRVIDESGNGSVGIELMSAIRSGLLTAACTASAAVVQCELIPGKEDPSLAAEKGKEDIKTSEGKEEEEKISLQDEKHESVEEDRNGNCSLQPAESDDKNNENKSQVEKSETVDDKPEFKVEKDGVAESEQESSNQDAAYSSDDGKLNEDLVVKDEESDLEHGNKDFESEEMGHLHGGEEKDDADDASEGKKEKEFSPPFTLELNRLGREIMESDANGNTAPVADLSNELESGEKLDEGAAQVETEESESEREIGADEGGERKSIQHEGEILKRLSLSGDLGKGSETLTFATSPEETQKLISDVVDEIVEEAEVVAKWKRASMGDLVGAELIKLSNVESPAECAESPCLLHETRDEIDEIESKESTLLESCEEKAHESEGEIENGFELNSDGPTERGSSSETQFSLDRKESLESGSKITTIDSHKSEQDKEPKSQISTSPQPTITEKANEAEGENEHSSQQEPIDFSAHDEDLDDEDYHGVPKTDEKCDSEKDNSKEKEIISETDLSTSVPLPTQPSSSISHFEEKDDSFSGAVEAASEEKECEGGDEEAPKAHPSPSTTLSEDPKEEIVISLKEDIQESLVTKNESTSNSSEEITRNETKCEEKTIVEMVHSVHEVAKDTIFEETISSFSSEKGIADSTEVEVGSEKVRELAEEIGESNEETSEPIKSTITHEMKIPIDGDEDSAGKKPKEIPDTVGGLPSYFSSIKTIVSPGGTTETMTKTTITRRFSSLESGHSEIEEGKEQKTRRLSERAEDEGEIDSGFISSLKEAKEMKETETKSLSQTSTSVVKTVEEEIDEKKGVLKESTYDYRYSYVFGTGPETEEEEDSSKHEDKSEKEGKKTTTEGKELPPVPTFKTYEIEETSHYEESSSKSLKASEVLAAQLESGQFYLSEKQTHELLIDDQETYSSGEFSDSQLSTVPPSHPRQPEIEDEVVNYPQSSFQDIENGNVSSAPSNNTITTKTSNIETISMKESSSILAASTTSSESSEVSTIRTSVKASTTLEKSSISEVVEEKGIPTKIKEEEENKPKGESSQVSASSGPEDIVKSWGKPLGLPAIFPEDGSASLDSGNFGKVTPKKEGKKTPSKTSGKKTRATPIYVDLAYVPHHGNSSYSDSEFFRLIRARYYVFSGLEPSREVFDGLLQGKKAWEDKNLDVTVIPTYDTDTLGYWVVDSEDALAEAKIDLAPSASRCTINLQDHETSCSAYRLEF